MKQWQPCSCFSCVVESCVECLDSVYLSEIQFAALNTPSSAPFSVCFQFYPPVGPIARELLSFTALFLLSSSSNIFTDFVLSFYDNDLNLRGNLIKFLLHCKDTVPRALLLSKCSIFRVRHRGQFLSGPYSRKSCAFLKLLVILILKTSKSCV